MKKGLQAVAVALAILAAGVAQAQQPEAAGPGASSSSLLQHYRAYVSARASADFKRAEIEAVAALTIAEATGDSRTGVLAFNLATLRAFELNDLSGAGDVAQKALAVGGAGVSQDAARLIIVLAGLGGNQERVRRTLNETMIAARSNDAADVDFLYRVARVWGYSALAAGREDSALEAYTHARDLANRMTGDAALDRAFAMVEMGALLIVKAREAQAYDLFTEAANILAPLAPESEGANVPPAEMLFAQAITWRGVARAKAAPSERQRMDAEVTDRANRDQAPRLCEGRLRAVPAPKFPRPAIDRLGIGAVTLRLSVGPDGFIRRVQVVGAVPRQDFIASVLAVASQWRYVWEETSPGCRRDTDDMLVPIRFDFED